MKLARARFSTYYTLETSGGRARIPLMRSSQFLGHHSDRCMRMYNEDRYCAGMLQLPSLSGDKTLSVFNVAIFDGHGGSGIAEFLAENLASYVEKLRPEAQPGRDIVEEFRKEYGGYWRTFGASMARIEREIRRSKYDDLALRLPLAFLQADFDVCKIDQMAGSTCTAAYLYPTRNTRTGLEKPWWEPGSSANLTVAQIGDTRCIIADNEGNCRPLSTVHHASNPHESDRLKKYELGFNWTNDGNERFLQYVNTRAFGDVQGKSRGISAEPDLVSYHVTGEKGGGLPGAEAFLVLVTDGVTDVASDQELTDIVIQTAVAGGSLRGSPQDAAMEIVSYAENLGTRDNSTALVVRLGGWGEWSQWNNRSGAEREEKLRYGPVRRQ